MIPIAFLICTIAAFILGAGMMSDFATQYERRAIARALSESGRVTIEGRVYKCVVVLDPSGDCDAEGCA